MVTSLDLAYMAESSEIIPHRNNAQVFMHLAEEVGEVSVCINRPHKADEPLVGELADVMNCALDLYVLNYGPDMTLLNEQINKKCAKWRKNAGV
ncbi:MazG-like pyrophosphatase [Vibrio phage D148]